MFQLPASKLMKARIQLSVVCLLFAWDGGAVLGDDVAQTADGTLMLESALQSAQYGMRQRANHQIDKAGSLGASDEDCGLLRLWVADVADESSLEQLSGFTAGVNRELAIRLLAYRFAQQRAHHLFAQVWELRSPEDEHVYVGWKSQLNQLLEADAQWSHWYAKSLWQTGEQAQALELWQSEDSAHALAEAIGLVGKCTQADQVVGLWRRWWGLAAPEERSLKWHLWDIVIQSAARADLKETEAWRLYQQGVARGESEAWLNHLRQALSREQQQQVRWVAALLHREAIEAGSLIYAIEQDETVENVADTLHSLGRYAPMRLESVCYGVDISAARWGEILAQLDKEEDKCLAGCLQVFIGHSDTSVAIPTQVSPKIKALALRACVVSGDWDKARAVWQTSPELHDSQQWSDMEQAWLTESLAVLGITWSVEAKPGSLVALVRLQQDSSLDDYTRFARWQSQLWQCAKQDISPLAYQQAAIWRMAFATDTTEAAGLWAVSNDDRLRDSSQWTALLAHIYGIAGNICDQNKLSLAAQTKFPFQRIWDEGRLQWLSQVSLSQSSDPATIEKQLASMRRCLRQIGSGVWPASKQQHVALWHYEEALDWIDAEQARRSHLRAMWSCTDQLTRARHALWGGRPQLAIKQLGELPQTASWDQKRQALIWSVKSYMSLGDIKSALEQLDNSDLQGGWKIVLQAELWTAQGKPEKARQYIAESLRESPKDQALLAWKLRQAAWGEETMHKTEVDSLYVNSLQDRLAYVVWQAKNGKAQEAQQQLNQVLSDTQLFLRADFNPALYWKMQLVQCDLKHLCGGKVSLAEWIRLCAVDGEIGEWANKRKQAHIKHKALPCLEYH